MSEIPMSYNPDILTQALRSRALSEKRLSARLGISLDDLEAELSRAPEPKQRILKKIATELSLPPFVFFMKHLPPTNDVIPDFRSANPRVMPKQKSTINAIQVAENIQKTLAKYALDKTLKLPSLRRSAGQSIDKDVLFVRNFFDIKLEDQAKAKNTAAFYSVCRKKIEDKGVIILHQSFSDEDGSGFCLAHEHQPIIVINTRRQNRGRRLFTLIHELCHVLLGKTGISDPFVRSNDVETFCNSFAGKFLVPEDYVQDLLGKLIAIDAPDPTDVEKISRKLKISQEATVLRLESLNIFRAGTYRSWKALFEGLDNPDYAEKPIYLTNPPPQEKYKVAKYGTRFAAVFSDFLDRKVLGPVEIYQLSGLKPKYQKPYFEYVQNLTQEEIFDLDVDDEQ